MIEATIARAIAEEVGRLVREQHPTGSPDDLVRLPGPLEPRAATRLVRTGQLPAKKIGRHWYTLRRHLAALIDARPTPATVDADAIIREHIQKRNR